MPYTAAQKRAYAKKMASSRARKAPARRRTVKRTTRAPYVRTAKTSFASRIGSALATAAMHLVPAGIGFLAGGPIGAKIAGAIAPSLIGGALGSGLMSGMNKSYGSHAMGNAAQDYQSGMSGIGRTIVGRGDYVVSGDVSQNSLLSGRPAKMLNKVHKGEMAISNQEFLGDIYTSNTAGAFQVQGYNLNPGLVASFPLAAAIFANYEEYRFEGLMFEFRSMSADALNSTNTALGSVIMATNYNANNPLFSSKAEMENYEGGVSCKPSKSVCHFVECARMQSVLDELYTRTGALQANQDYRFSDLGVFQIATTGFQAANVNIGELWVSYQIAGLKLRMYVTLGNFNGYWRQINSAYNATTGLLGTGTVTPYYQNMTCAVAVVGASGALATYTNGLYFPSSSIKQSYKVILIWSGAGASAIRFPQFITVGCYETWSGAPAEGAPTVTYEWATPAVGDTAFACSCSINVTTDGLAGIRGFGGTSGGSIPGPYIAFQNSTTVLPTAGNEMEIIVQQVPNAGGLPPTPGTDW